MCKNFVYYAYDGVDIGSEFRDGFFFGKEIKCKL